MTRNPRSNGGITMGVLIVAIIIIVVLRLLLLPVVQT